MTKNSTVAHLQEVLQQHQIPGWLFYDFRGLDPIAHSVLGLDPTAHATRRWFYLVPARGEPRKLVHRIESGRLDQLPGEKRVYLRWQELDRELRSMLEAVPTVAMQYSAGNAIPYVSRVDAGTLEMVRSAGAQVVSSADLIQQIDAVWSGAQVDEHRRNAEIITRIMEEAFEWAARRIRDAAGTSELAVQEFILGRLDEEGLVTDHPPIVGVGAHSGDPHYAPTPETDAAIGRDDFLLIDLWARGSHAPEAVFADITWTAWFGSSPPERISDVAAIVRRARDRGIEVLEAAAASGEPLAGWVVDQEVRAVIEEAGYGEAFVHRTGHNLGHEVHGNGVNFDNLETHDERTVIPGIACTIEPGIYLEDFGVRSEVNIYMGADGPEVTTPPQRELLVIGC